MKQINFLHEFFNSKSDANKYLNVASQEDLEDDFESWFLEKLDDFEFAAQPLIKHLAEQYHPHTIVIVSSDRAEILEGVKCYKTDKILID